MYTHTVFYTVPSTLCIQCTHIDVELPHGIRKKVILKQTVAKTIKDKELNKE